IRKHTLAAAQMSALDCIIYLADTLEPGRTYPDRAALAELSHRDLHAAMQATIASSIRYLVAKHLPVAPKTLEAASAFGLSMQDQEVLSAGAT
ncbi:MAG: HD domain-containing protein, partial [Candidatus Eremiobacteraeota bacterium]|nr:HD domain-containing protein [Candidatus Eremiobacteraeota bacterium]